MNAASPSPLLEVRDVVVRHDRAAAPTVRGASFSLERGECVALVGASGCGKSTLCRTIVGLGAAESGSILWHGRDVTALTRAARREFRAAVQMVFQDTSGALDPRMSIENTLEEPLLVHFRKRYPTASSRRRRVAELLEKVELSPDLATRHPHELSGGQRQRIGIARALATEPEVLIADEPLSALDVAVQARLLRTLEKLLRESGLAMLFVSHDLAVVRCLCSRILVMDGGRFVEEGETDSVLVSPRHPFTRRLLAACPSFHS